MQYALIVFSPPKKQNEILSLKQELDALSSSIRSIEGSVLLAENVFLFPVRNGSPTFLKALHTLGRLGIEHHFAVLPEIPEIVSS